ncbi:MAG: hypothetical protein HOH43_09545 [Candidatus Latescibacteria bacterium]|jgi:hypothetical protein|nr:hypothetical protein [Candidatus Latescibacterota bacterium]
MAHIPDLDWYWWLLIVVGLISLFSVYRWFSSDRQNDPPDDIYPLY